MTLALLLWLAQADPIAAGNAAMDAGKFAEAEQHFQKVVDRNPTDYGALFNLSMAQSFQNKDEQAIAGLKKVLEMKPGLYEAEVNLALLYFRYRKFPEAMPLMEAAIAKKPTDVRMFWHLAEAQRESKRCADAEPNYRKALQLDSSLTAAQLGLGRCLVEMKRPDDALPLFEKAGATLELAQVYEDAGNWDKVIPLYEAALKTEPSLALQTRLAAAYLRTKQPDKAQEVIEAALKTAPNDFDLILTHGRLLRDKRDFAGAAREFAKAAQIKPDSAEALNELAGMFVSLNEDARAIAVFDRLKQLEAETPAHLFFRAVVLDRNHQVKPALAAYRAFLAVSNEKYPDEEFKARQRARILEREASRK